MYSLTVAFGSTMWTLMFKSEATARVAYAEILLGAKPRVQIRDDFGHDLCLQGSSVHGAVLEDMDQSKLAHCERALHQQRTQIHAQNMAMADATIRASRFQQGPAVIAPQGMGGTNGFGR